MSRRTLPLKPGDRVAYSAKFLRATGQRTGKVPEMRGTIEGYGDIAGILIVQWDHGPALGVLEGCLCREDRIGIDAALADQVPAK